MEVNDILIRTRRSKYVPESSVLPCVRKYLGEPGTYRVDGVGDVIGWKFASGDRAERFIAGRQDKFVGLLESVTDTVSKAVSFVPSGEDWAKIQKFMLVKDGYKPEDFRVYRVNLANDQEDRDRERFTVKLLKVFAETIVGKSFMLRHDTYGSLPEGRWFDAGVRKVDGINFLTAKFFINAKKAELVENLETGVWRDFSIGFYAKVLTRIEDKDTGKVVWEWDTKSPGDAEAVEGSLVYLGAQYHSHTTVKDAGSGEVSPSNPIISGMYWDFGSKSKGKDVKKKLPITFGGSVKVLVVESGETGIDDEAMETAVTDVVKSFVGDATAKLTGDLAVETGKVKELSDVVDETRRSLISTILATEKTAGLLEDKPEATDVRSAELSKLKTVDLVSALLLSAEKAGGSKATTLNGATPPPEPENKPSGEVKVHIPRW